MPTFFGTSKNSSNVKAPIVADLTKKPPTSTSPDCFARVIRYTRRDTRDYENTRPVPKLNTTSKIDISSPGKTTFSGIRHEKVDKQINSDTHLVESFTTSSFDIASDIISCVVMKSKTSPIGQFNLILSPADIDYHHVLHSGDHIIIWMKRNRVNKMTKESDDIFNNDMDSGLKMYGIITDVRKLFTVNPNGSKSLRYRIAGQDVGYFFNSDVYYNASISEQFKDFTIFNLMLRQSIGQISTVPSSPSDLTSAFIQLYLGKGPDASWNSTPLGVRPRITENNILYLPKEVAKTFSINLINRPNVVTNNIPTFTDVLAKRIGIETYTSNDVTPQYIKDSKNIVKPLPGYKIITIDTGNQTKLWSLLQSCANVTVNEMFFDLKPCKVSSVTVTVNNQQLPSICKLYPTFVLRQIPFTSSSAKKLFNSDKIDCTAFVELPRTIIPESYILSEDIGRGAHERFNFIELFGVNGLGDWIPPSAQVAMGNYAIDTASVKRYGLRALITNTEFYLPWTFTNKDFDVAKNLSYIPDWIALLSDWWLGAHVFDSGTFEFVGIEEALTLGDNIEIARENGVHELYHIENYQHIYLVSPDGKKTFKTLVQVTRGQRVDEYPIYASGQINEQNVLDIGLTDTEFEGTARPGDSNSENVSGISATERPNNRKQSKE